MSQKISDYSKLLKTIDSAVKKHRGGPLLVGVDGGDGAGKSYIAEGLWKDLGGAIIHGDNFKTGNLKDEHEFLIDELNQEISTFKQIHSFFIILESVLLWDALDRLNIRPNIVVYVKHISGNNGVLWVDEDELGNFEPFPGASPFRKQVIAYHKSHKPVEKADVIYLNSWQGS